MKELQCIKKYNFGRLLRMLNSNIEFTNKSGFIKNCDHINKLRNEFAHRIIDNYNEEDVYSKLSHVHEVFRTIFRMWGDSSTTLYKEIDRIKNRPEIKKLLEKNSLRPLTRQ